MRWVYILHFDDPVSQHAQHYSGSTSALRRRLESHASGHGSKLTRELHTRGITWRLGALTECTITGMRQLERYLKDQHNAKRYCEICNPNPMRIGDGRPWDLSLVGFPTTSTELDNLADGRDPVFVRSASETDHNFLSIQSQMIALQRADKDALGFIPTSGHEGLTTLQRTGRIALAQVGPAIIGYAAWTACNDGDSVRIHQCVVEDSWRCRGIGKTLVDHVAEQSQRKTIVCTVRSDLPANLFWAAIGFKHCGVKLHPTSNSTLNQYRKDT